MRRKKEALLILILLFSFCFLASLNADILYLKNGRSIEGIIKSEDTDGIELEIKSGAVKFQRGAIENVHRGTREEHEALREVWKKEEEKFSAQQKSEGGQPKTVAFSRESNSIVVEATLNKKVRADLVLDTGASMTLLKREVAEKLGINLDKLRPNTIITVADGRQVPAAYINLASVKVQGVEADNVEAAVFLNEYGSPAFHDGLLGMSFLKRFNFKIDYTQAKLTLQKR